MKVSSGRYTVLDHVLLIVRLSVSVAQTPILSRAPTAETLSASDPPLAHVLLSSNWNPRGVVRIPAWAMEDSIYGYAKIGCAVTQEHTSQGVRYVPLQLCDFGGPYSMSVDKGRLFARRCEFLKNLSSSLSLPMA